MSFGLEFEIGYVIILYLFVADFSWLSPRYKITATILYGVECTRSFSLILWVVNCW